ncbi:MAG: MoxR family ATPase [Actinomycetales bacterium]|nr:MoxR family ATPase [Actinomycetales bacterium]
MTSTPQQATTPGDVYRRVAWNVQQVIQGKPEVVRLAIACLFAEGHLLVEDVPGLGKTSLARSIASSIDGSWRRIQFTPDLLPGDITGVMVFNQSAARFEFHPGGIFSNLVVADEINRGTPKTQAALLEVMEERRVTVDAITHDVPRPFMVVATQNPIDMDGTYRLPEAQLDRFLMRISVGYPDADAEARVVLGEGAGPTPEDLPPVVDLATLRAVVAQVRTSHVDPQIAAYAVALASATRDDVDVRLGASPRGSIALVKAARAVAALGDRAYVTPDDVKDVAQPVLAHRLILTPEAEIRGVSPADVITRVLTGTPVPRASSRLVG